MGKWTVLWGGVEKNKKIAWKNKKNLLGGSLSCVVPRKGEGVPLPTVSPVSCLIPVCLCDERHTHARNTQKSYISPSEAYQEAPKAYILIVKYTLSIPYNNVYLTNTLTLKEK